MPCTELPEMKMKIKWNATTLGQLHLKAEQGKGQTEWECVMAEILLLSNNSALVAVWHCMDHERVLKAATSTGLGINEHLATPVSSMFPKMFSLGTSTLLGNSNNFLTIQHDPGKVLPTV